MRMRERVRRERRGIAMLLVLISLGMAVILTGAYVTSRDNSATIGENVASACTARSAAMAGLDVSVAILQTETAWRTSHSNGLLLDDFDLDGTPIDVELVDMVTGMPPDETTTYVRIIVTATEAGVEQGVAATAHVPLESGEGSVVDVDLSEFAIFTGEYINLNGNATVTRWPNAPTASQGKRVAFGTHATSLNSVEISSGAAAIDTDLYVGPDASLLGLVNNLSSQLLNEVELLDNVPLPDPPSTGVLIPDDPGASDYSSKDLTAQNESISSDSRWNVVSLQNGSELRLEGDITVALEGSLLMRTDSRLIVDGNVKLIVFGGLAIDEAGIELEDGATLEMYVGDAMVLDDAYVGDFRADPNLRDNSGSSPWMDPERIQIFSMKMSEMVFGYDEADIWDLTANSVVKASMYAPVRRVKIRDTSALYGRITARSIEMNNDGAIFYDHGLDDGFGFTNTSSPLYDSSGRMKSGFLALPSLDTSSLQEVFDSTGVPIRSAGRTVGTVQEDSTPPPEPGDPTPRPVPVEYDVTSLGTDVATWENGA